MAGHLSAPMPPSLEAIAERFAEVTPAKTGAGAPATHRRGRPGLTYEARFHTPGVHPFDEVQWERRAARILGRGGAAVFEQEDVEVPAAWSQLATNVVASKYFRGKLGTPEREHSVKHLIERVARTITEWGIRNGTLADADSAVAFYGDLCWILVNQVACFNSPVWFNVGVERKPQCSACFINSVADTMESILDLAKVEGLLFKYGSGAGVNLSSLRGSQEPLSSGGTASGPVSFMRGYDAFAAAIKSGGRTRRAAKMQILNCDHPDLLEFVDAKPREERKAWALLEAGFSPGIDGEAYGSVFFQNSNLSVRATNAFMQAAEADEPWELKAVNVRAGQPRPTLRTVRAREVLRRIAHGTWICGDPGLQFHDTINDWNPVRDCGEIRASNPCSEFMFLDDTACNLASINLRKFQQNGRAFDVEGFRHCVRLMILAQDILVDNAGYPTPKIERNSHEYRPLGLGYANLGALLMSMGFAYNSDGGRELAGCITALMTGEAYLASAELAERVGAFAHFENNRESFLRVIDKHGAAARSLARSIHEQGVPVDENLVRAAVESWERAYAAGREHGFRNAQTTVIAPTGTIAFMMDCATTGIEPDIALVKYKQLVGGGTLKLVNPTVPEALRNLGYTAAQIKEIQLYLDERETIEGAPHVRDAHLPVFDCAFLPKHGVRAIAYTGHLRMMAAVQPFLSGAISKTINMPQSATVEEIEQAYIQAWKLGIKAVAIYRDGSKRTQPLSTKGEAKPETEAAGMPSAGQDEADRAPDGGRTLARRRLPDERRSITHKFSISGHEGYVTVGLFPDGTPGEIFVRMAKQGSFVSGLMDAFATATSIMLQYGVPLHVLVDKFTHLRFEPDGLTGNREIPFARSVLDYLFRWLALKFLHGPGADGTPSTGTAAADAGGAALNHAAAPALTNAAEPVEPPVADMAAARLQMDAPPCPVCGSLMLRAGACYQCPNCAHQEGCG